MKKEKFIVLGFLLVFLGVVMCAKQKDSLGIFEAATDVGDCKIPGTLSYDVQNQLYRMGSSGHNMWFKKDDFHFAWKRMSGDFILTAQFEFMGEGVDPHRKVGWMVRKSLDTDSPYADAVVHGDGLTSLQFRRDFAMDTEEMAAGIKAPDVIQFEKQGDTFIMRAAKFGEPLIETGSIDLPLGDSLYVGLAMCSHNDTTFEQAVIKNVRIEVPAPADFRPYQDYGGSRLEILEVETGDRRIVYESDDNLEAPNWTRDGKALIYNSHGLLYRFDLQTKQPQQLDTGMATRCNNDHVISFDGSRIGISHHVEGEEGGGSAVFVMPIEGGTPKRVTPLTPSYLHGWSPDDQYLIYTAQRNGVYDIYRISVHGGEETRLTSHPMLDDGSEYSPDGSWIFFNSARTGTMQIWRMKPDGSALQQLTFDDWNDWFPHVSPDGKQVIFISFPPEVDAQDHPYYKRVMLRIMPFDGGEPQVVAYLYGGQGTINVPSWSPDSKKVAFVSNSW